MHPLLIIGLIITAAGLVASASDSGEQKKPQQQGGEPSPDQNPPEPQDEVSPEQLEDEALDKIFNLPALQQHLPATYPDMEKVRRDIREMYREHPRALIGTMEPLALKMSALYKDKGDDENAEWWQHFAKLIREAGEEKPR